MYWGGNMGMGWGVMIEEEVGGGGWRKGPWTAEEDRLLIEYVKIHGEGRWNSVARLAGLKRNGKSCRLRWVNYLRPDLKRGQITPQEESIILELHARWGNRWSTIARSLPGRTDNEIKNYWRTHFKKKVKNPSDAAEKAKSRLLRRQQFQQQQQLKQQQQQIQQQQQEIQFNLDMKGIMMMNLLEMGNHNNDNRRVPSISQQEPQDMYQQQSSTEEEHGYFYHPMFINNINGNNNDNYSPAATESSSDEILWDGLWNLDDVLGNFTAASATSKPTTLVAPFC
ncbi:hypothetical protein HN51_028770 [Arachis hypogaea]|uniref:Uncharacterized protein n=2 Tax=Arachis TaxID=3817 RepID=A0A445BH61_ARAHY|nr:transcription factor MYB2 [Arachis duranensis]XP_025619789.1 transcription factor MYB2 [Arachis hypogaea]XP_057726090.1 transcription factor MYB2 [Arachis stenosperma]QHO35324.1 R2R3-MYB factor [Arachis hypogaea]RYR38022.1 hypothetical protein Ahy_A09g042964 [Arachis hypogaea]